MGWSLKIGTLFGIDLKVHFSFLLILIWGAYNFGGDAGPLYGILVTVALFSIVLLHELGHSVAAIWYGISVKDIILLPIGGVARLERMPEKPVQELVVAIAGPAVNVILAALLLPIILAINVAQSQPVFFGSNLEPGVQGFLTFLLLANISLLIFNMIPAFPLDGGRVFRAFLGFFLDYGKATKVAITVGRILALLMGLYGFFTGQIIMAVVALFIFGAGGQEGQTVAARNLLKGVLAQQALSERPIALSPDATVGQAASIMLQNSQSNYAVLDSISGQFLGAVTNQSISEAMQSGQWHTRITDIMYQASNIPKIETTTPLDEVQDKISATTGSVGAVYEGLHFKGLITSNDIYRVFRYLSQNRPSAGRMAA